MNHTIRGQLFFECFSETAQSFENFHFHSGNHLAFKEMLSFFSNDCNASSLLMIGPSGVGKSHLLMAGVSEFSRLYKKGKYLSLPSFREEFFSGNKEDDLFKLNQLSTENIVAIDDFEAVDDDPGLQELILYLFNLLKSNNGKLILASLIPVEQFSHLRSELKSRLLWGQIIKIDKPNDDELVGILMKMAENKNIRLSHQLVKYLSFRLPRSIEDYTNAIFELDRQSAILGEKIGIPLAKRIFRFR